MTHQPTRRHRGFRTALLVSAVNMASAALNANAQSGAVSVTDGSTLNLPNLTYPNPGYDVSSGHGFYVSGTGSTIIGQNLSMTTTGAWGYPAYVRNGGTLILHDSRLQGTSGVVVDGAGAYAELNRGSITASGEAVRVSAGARASLDGTIVEAGNQATILSVDGSGVLTVRDARITASQGGSLTAYTGGRLVLSGGRLHIGQDAPNAYSGIVITDSTLEIDGTTIEIWSRYKDAINLTNQAHATLRDASVTMHGESASALSVPSILASATVTNTRFETFGRSVLGVDARTGAQVTWDGGSIVTHGDSAHGLYASTVFYDWQAQGIHQASIRARNLDITTTGSGAYGVISRTRDARIELDDVRVTTMQDRSTALYASLQGAILGVRNSTVRTYGAQAYGIDVNDRATLSVADSQLYTSGRNAAALLSRITTADDYTNVIPVTGSVLDTQNAPAVLVLGGGMELTLRDSQVIGRSNGGDGTAILADDAIYTNGTVIPFNKAIVTADASRLTGDVLVRSGNAASTFSLSLRNASTLTGAVKARNGTLTLDGTSQWHVRGDSTLGTLDNGGSVHFMAPAGGAFKTVTVHGNYTGRDGLLVMNAALGDDNSATDRLVVAGDTAGSTRVRINNAGGSGGLAGNGIELVHVDGQSAGVFAQQGRVIVDGYEYTLYKGSLSDPGDGHWYLRSVALPTPPAPGGGPDRKWASPLVGAYLGNQTAAVRMFDHSLRDRMAAPHSTESDKSGDGRAVWLRVIGNRMDSEAARRELDLRTDTAIVQFGGDLAQWSGNGDDRWHLGLMAAYGHGTTDATNPVDYGNSRLRKARGKVDGYGVGAYATWYGDAALSAGPYVDAWLHYGWFDNEASASGGKADSYRSRNLSASLEAGYAFTLSDDGSRQLMIEPQAQVIVNRYRADDHRTAHGAEIHHADGDGITTRLGARMHGKTTTGHGVLPFVELNWLHGGADDSLRFGGGAFAHDVPKDRYEIKAGLRARLAGNWQGWASVDWQTGNDGYRRLGGLAGLRYAW